MAALHFASDDWSRSSGIENICNEPVKTMISYPAARKRLLAMRSALKKHEDHIGAVTIVSEKK